MRSGVAVGVAWLVLVVGCAEERSSDSGTRMDADVQAPASMDAGADGSVVDGGLLGADAAQPGSDASLPDGGSPYRALRLPFVGYLKPEAPAGNPITADKALLGKALFWDVQLSSDDTVACGTCHTPEAGGSDGRTALPDTPGHPGADGFLGTEDDPRGSPGIARCRQQAGGGIMPVDDPIYGLSPRVTRRRSMSFIDAMFPDELFWDGRAPTDFRDPLAAPDEDAGVLLTGAALESQAVGPILNDVEMACEGRGWADVTAKLAPSSPLRLAKDVPPALAQFVQGATYAELFERVFGDPDVTPARIAMAIATYERTLTADQTPWDHFQAGDDSALTPQQVEGLTLFVGTAFCTTCHQPPYFGASFYMNDGFVADGWDQGRFEIDENFLNRGAFRVVSLRNVGLREAGGMLHDGLWPGTDMETLIERYNLAPVGGQTLFRRALALSQAERAALVAFLRDGLTDPRVAAAQPPFDHPRP